MLHSVENQCRIDNGECYFSMFEDNSFGFGFKKDRFGLQSPKSELAKMVIHVFER